MFWLSLCDVRKEISKIKKKIQNCYENRKRAGSSHSVCHGEKNMTPPSCVRMREKTTIEWHKEGKKEIDLFIFLLLLLSLRLGRRKGQGKMKVPHYLVSFCFIPFFRLICLFVCLQVILIFVGGFLIFFIYVHLIFVITVVVILWYNNLLTS